MFSEPDETDIVETLIPKKLEKQDNITDPSSIDIPQYTERIDEESTYNNHEASIDEHEETVKDEKEEIRLKVQTHNLEAFIKNGIITIFEESEMSDSSSMNTEIVNRIRNGDNVTIYTQSEGDYESTNISQDNEITSSFSEEEMVKELIENVEKTRKKVIIVVAPTNYPLPLPS